MCPRAEFRPFAETACFLMLRFQADAASLLKLVEWFGIWRLWAATKIDYTSVGALLKLYQYLQVTKKLRGVKTFTTRRHTLSLGRASLCGIYTLEIR